MHVYIMLSCHILLYTVLHIILFNDTSLSPPVSDQLLINYLRINRCLRHRRGSRGGSALRERLGRTRTCEVGESSPTQGISSDPNPIPVLMRRRLPPKSRHSTAFTSRISFRTPIP